MNKREWMLQAALAGIGSGRDFDIDIAVHNAAKLYDAICAASPEPADDGWIEHRGEKPYPEGLVEYVCQSGERNTAYSDYLDWTHDEDLLDSIIVKWRPAT